MSTRNWSSLTTSTTCGENNSAALLWVLTANQRCVLEEFVSSEHGRNLRATPQTIPCTSQCSPAQSDPKHGSLSNPESHAGGKSRALVRSCISKLCTCRGSSHPHLTFVCPLLIPAHPCSSLLPPRAAMTQVAQQWPTHLSSGQEEPLLGAAPLLGLSCSLDRPPQGLPSPFSCWKPQSIPR